MTAGRAARAHRRSLVAKACFQNAGCGRPRPQHNARQSGCGSNLSDHFAGGDRCARDGRTPKIFEKRALAKIRLTGRSALP